MPLAPFGRSERAAISCARAATASFHFELRHHLVDQPPFDRLGAAHALLDRAEHIGAVAPHLALVGDAGEPAGAGQHREQRRLRQRHRRAAVVDQHDVVGGERQLVAAAGRSCR